MRLAQRAAGVVLVLALAACSGVNAPAATAPRVPGSEPTPASTTPASTPAPTPTPTPTPDPAMLEPATADGWRPVPDSALVAGSQWQDVIWTGSRFLAAGDGVLIGSDDGIRWSRIDPEPGARVGTLAMVGSTVRAAGTMGDTEVAWSSEDARTWTRLPEGSPVPGPSLIQTTDGWVRVDTVYDSEICVSVCDPSMGRSAVSRDGLTWTVSGRQPTLAKVELSAVVEWNGSLLAAGTKWPNAAIWSSDDGLRWSRVAGSTFRPRDPDAVVYPVAFARIGSALVLAGYETTQDSGTVRAWWSPDGHTWADAVVEGDGPSGQLNDVWSSGDELIATGWSEGCRAWSTLDGRSWSCIAADARMSVLSTWGIAASPTVQVLVGMTDEGWDEDGEQGPPGDIWWRARP